jgi:integrase
VTGAARSAVVISARLVVTVAAWTSARVAPQEYPRAIMEVLGHSGISVTMNTYAHVLPALRQEAADAIDEPFGA